MIRWTATVHYRTNAGIVDVTHDLSEIAELHDRVEAGPHWDAIERIEIVRHHPGIPALTVEKADQL